MTILLGLLRILLIPALVVGPIVYLVLLNLRGRWGMRTVTDTALCVIAPLVPAVSTSPQNMLGKIGRRLRGSSVITASGAKGAAALCTVVMGKFSFDQVLSEYPEDEIGTEFALVYTQHAIREGWKIPIGGCEVTFAEDPRMRPGWIRIETKPGSYLKATPASRAMSSATPGSEPDFAVERSAGDTIENEEVDLGCFLHGEPTMLLLDPGETQIAYPAPMRLVANVGAAEVALPRVGMALSVGRHQSNTLVLRDELASRVHAEIDVMREHLAVRDLESRNGTWVNSKRISGPTRLRAGDILAFALQGPSFKVMAAKPASTKAR